MIAGSASDVSNDLEDLLDPGLFQDFDGADFESLKRLCVAAGQRRGFRAARILNLNLQVVKNAGNHLRYGRRGIGLIRGQSKKTESWAVHLLIC